MKSQEILSKFYKVYEIYNCYKGYSCNEFFDQCGKYGCHKVGAFETQELWQECRFLQHPPIDETIAWKLINVLLHFGLEYGNHGMVKL